MEVSVFQCVTTTFLPSLLLCEVEFGLLRQVWETEGVEGADIDDIVWSMMDLSLDQSIYSLQDRNTFLGLIENARQAQQPRRQAQLYSTYRPQLRTASAPEHPSILISFNPSIATPPRTASPTRLFVTVGQKETERLTLQRHCATRTAEHDGDHGLSPQPK